MNGSQILAEALERQGVDMFFFIMGAPMLMVEAEALQRRLRGIDVRHEQAAAMMAHAYARLRLRPGVCRLVREGRPVQQAEGTHGRQEGQGRLRVRRPRVRRCGGRLLPLIASDVSTTGRASRSPGRVAPPGLPHPGGVFRLAVGSG